MEKNRLKSMLDEIGAPIVDMGSAGVEGGLAHTLYSMDDHSLSSDRPYDGQPHTDQGERGKTLVEGLTMRDICDCYVLGFLMATDRMGLAESGTATYNDVYEAQEGDPDFDPIAAMQNMMCEIEKRMGIYPNVPELRPTKEN